MSDAVLVALRSIGITDPDELARAAEIVGAATETANGSGPAAPAASELDAALAEAAPLVDAAHLVTVGDQLFRIRPIKGGTFMRFTAALGSKDPTVMGAAVGRMVATIVDPDDAERLYDAMDALDWTVDQAMEWFASHVEVDTGRPTGPPSPSGPRRVTTTPSSNGDSPPTATP